MARKGLFPASVKAGVPKIPNIPKDWSLVPFGEVVRIVERPAELKDDEEYQLVTAKRSRGGIVSREKLLGKEILTKTQFYINAGDFLISRRQIIHGACGLVPQSLDGAIVSNEYSTLLTKPNLLKEYFTYFSHTTYFQQTCFQSSVGVDIEKMIFKIDDWLKYKFPLPPLHEQQKIAEILSSVDRSIALTQAVITQTRKVKQGLLQQLLTRGIGHTKFKETAIGRIPESWEIKSLDHFLSKNAVKNGLYKPAKDYGDGTPIIRIDDFENGEKLYRSPHNRVLLSSIEIETYRVYEGDILINRVNSVSHLGKSALIVGLDEPTVFESNMMCVRLSKDSILLPKFLRLLLISDYGQKQIKNSAKLAIAQASINQQDVYAFQFSFPSIKEQTEIIERLDSIEVEINSLNNELNLLRTLKSGLMQDLLTGRIRVAV